VPEALIEHVNLTVSDIERSARLFESLWQSRVESDKRPHFGLGLYIVRLIAEFHGGTARAENLPDNSGAVFTVRLGA